MRARQPAGARRLRATRGSRGGGPTAARTGTADGGSAAACGAQRPSGRGDLRRPAGRGGLRGSAGATVTADWADASFAADGFDCVIVPGARAPELLVTHESAVALIREFADKGKVVASIGQGHLLLAAAELLRGRRCAAGVPMKMVSRLARAAAVESGGAVADGKLVTVADSTDLAPFVARVVDLLGITVSF